MAFKDPRTERVEIIDGAWIGLLLLNFIYPLLKGAWRATWIVIGVTLITGFIGWFVLPLAADKLMRDSFLDRGWVEIPAPEKERIEDDWLRWVPWALFGLGAALAIVPRVLIWYWG